ncbi:putative hNH nuclease [Mycobacterium xenopi 4042]|uniref:Putative hNH nuclease n=1 Tax=Mycobacterium xenopi 4042 TaxID=1299334 RepID=X7ZP37_MYCXE|nr:putative hNH nuclease [Mycobacterium xenopi 4042]
MMADTLVERVTGRAADVAEPVAVNLVISDETLLGGADAAARIDGYGRSRRAWRATWLAPRLPMPGRGQRCAGSTGIRAPGLSGDGVAGAPLPNGLAAFISLRDQRCRTPYCDARSDTATTRCRTAAADRPTSPTGSVRVSAAITSRNRLAGGSPRAWMKPVGTQHNSPHRRGCITTRRHHRNPGPDGHGQ